ncbi:MAG TPA: hypothetical protein VLZ83_08760 [Edaphocola sp.]|nr:hypothetical protein [Edaphocola sp.]
MKLIQKVGFNKKEFELINDSEIIIKETSLLSSKEWSVDIEYIGHRKLVETNSRKGVQIIGTIFILIAIVCWITIFVEENLNGGIDGLIWGGLFMLLLGIICFKAPMDNKLFLSGGHSNLTFYLNSPSRLEVEFFVDTIINLSKKSLKDKFSRIDPDLPEETFMNQMNWLLHNKLIDENEYDEKKNQYKILKLTK